MRFHRPICLAVALVLGAVAVSNAQTYVNRQWYQDPVDSTWMYNIYPVWYDTAAVWDSLGWENGPYPGGLPFIVEDLVGVNQLGDLSIEPGVEILSDSNGTFVADYGGSIAASGTGEHPIVFDFLEGTRGLWGGFDILGSSTLALYECVIRNAGCNRSSVVFADYMTYWFSIDGCRFETNDPDDFVILAYELYEGEIKNNTFVSNMSGIIHVSAQTAGLIDIFGNSATGNEMNGISVDCINPIFSVFSWEADLPYVLETLQTSTLVIEPGGELILAPGTVVKFNTCPGIQVSGGSLDAQGTPLEHIVFTSFADDANGGDTNGDGTQSFPVPGDWGRIAVEYSGTALFDFCDVYYAGGLGDGVLVLWDHSHAGVSNSRFRLNESNYSPVVSLSPGRGGGQPRNGCVCSMVNTLIADNPGESGAVIVHGGSDTLIMFSCILDNNESGVSLFDGSVFEIHHCDFLNLPYVALENYSGSYVNAQFNWWNDPSGPSGIGPGTGTPIMGDSVYFIPWKTFGGNEGGGSGIDTTNTDIQGPNNDYTDPTEGLGCPDERWVSLGVDGFATLDFGEVIEVGEGPEFTIFESDSETTGRPSYEEEGFGIYGKSDQGGFSYVDRGTGTETIDMGQERLDAFRYLKVVDDGDGDPNSTSPGYDLDAIYTEYPLPMAKVWIQDSIFPYDDDTMNFGNVEIDDTSYAHVVVHNLGDDTLSLEEIALETGQNFFYALPFLPTDIVYGDPYAFYVGFAPTEAAAYEDALLIVTDDAWEDTVIVDLLGQGVPTGTAENDRYVPSCDYLRLDGPVPCGDELLLSFGLSGPGDVHIRLYDVTGRRVDRVFGGHRQAGVYHVVYHFDHDLPGGTYFVEMDVGRDRQVRKIVIR
jgi:hypothetical protein